MTGVPFSVLAALLGTVEQNQQSCRETVQLAKIDKVGLVMVLELQDNRWHLVHVLFRAAGAVAGRFFANIALGLYSGSTLALACNRIEHFAHATVQR